MGKIKQGLLGPLSGKVGNVIGASWRGIDYLRIVPAHITDPQTPSQLEQRGKFKAALSFLQPLLGFLRIGFKGYAEGMSAFNAAMSYNLLNAVAGIDPDYYVEPADALVSRGTLRAVASATAAATGLRAIEVTWEDNSGMGNASFDDNAMLVVVNPAKADVDVLLQAGQRGDGLAEITVPEAYVGDDVHVYLVFSTLDDLLSTGGRDAIANSVFAGTVTVT
jgi:hypothetical protein